ncbi:MAG: hypothetical protein K2G02_02795, partial [Phocaeicola sp.]|nr:hypothetical protein [Phocaeicola sp.]
TEKTTVIETVNSMMLQTVEDVIHLFPCWTKTPASFTRLRAKGAFLVSAHYDGTTVSGLEIFSEKGGVCKLSNPWKGKTVRVTENGKAVSVKKEKEVFSFKTRKGCVYVID